MIDKAVFVAALACLAAAGATGQDVAATLADSEPFGQVEDSASPRVSALRESLASGKAGSVARFWAEIREQSAPLVEPAPQGRNRSLVTFLWQGDADTRNVVLIGGPAGVDLPNNQMAHISGTDVWYKTYEIRNDARFIYSFSPNDNLVPLEKIDPKDREAMDARLADLRPDPLNPRLDPSGMPSSYVELPRAAPQRWISPDPRVPKGEVEERRLSSAILNNERDLWIYTPPEFSQTGGPYPLLVLFDGGAYVDVVPTPVILDNLIAAGSIPPIVAAFVGNATRSSRAVELACSADFADFLAEELVPLVRKRYRAAEDPRNVAAGGSSFGGLAAAFAAFRHPQVFGAVLSQSGSFWWKPRDQTEPEWLTRQYAGAAKSKVRLFLEVGLMEHGASLTGPSLLGANRRLRDALADKGYSIRFREFNGGHSYINWRGGLAEGLVYLFGESEAASAQ